MIKFSMNGYLEEKNSQGTPQRVTPPMSFKHYTTNSIKDSCSLLFVSLCVGRYIGVEARLRKSHIVPFRYHTGRGTYSVLVFFFCFFFFLFFFVLFVFFQFELMLKGKLHFIYFPGIESDEFAFSLDQNLLLVGSCQTKLRQQKQLQIIHNHYPLFDFVHDISEKTSGNSKVAEFLVLTDVWQ